MFDSGVVTNRVSSVTALEFETNRLVSNMYHWFGLSVKKYPSDSSKAALFLVETLSLFLFLSALYRFVS